MKKSIYDIFICYEETTGLSIAVHQKSTLEKYNIKAFVSKSDISRSEDWHSIIDNYIKKCKCFIPILTPGVFSSHQVVREINLATDLNKTTLPCIYHEIYNSKFSEFLAMPPFDRLNDNQGIIFRDEFDLASKLHLALSNMKFFKEKYIPALILQKIDEKLSIKDKYKSHDSTARNASVINTVNEFAEEARAKGTLKEVSKIHKDLNIGKEPNYKQARYARNGEEREKNA